jgi:hypothetical protein
MQFVLRSKLYLTKFLNSVQFLNKICGSLTKKKYITKAKRHVPECVQFLNGVLYLAVDWSAEANKTSPLLTSFELTAIYESFRKTKVKLVPSKKTYNLKL